LTVAEAAKALNVATRTIRRHIKSGDLKTELVAGKYGMEYRILALPEKLTSRTIPMDIPNDSGLSSALDMAAELQKENKYLALSLENTREKVSQLEKLLLALVNQEGGAEIKSCLATAAQAAGEPRPAGRGTREP